MRNSFRLFLIFLLLFFSYLNQSLAQTPPAPPAQPIIPANGGTLFTYENRLSWSEVTGARAYQYAVSFDRSDETRDECIDLEGQQIISSQTALSNSVSIYLECLGRYSWKVRSCLDSTCQNAGAWVSPPWTFTYVQPAPPEQFGILPCNRASDDPDTPWNERNRCEIKHVILVFKNIIDLILWRIGLIVLALLVVFTAIIYFFSLGTPSTIANVKSLWKRAGQGYAIMLLSWVIINLLVRLVGFTDQWWVIPF